MKAKELYALYLIDLEKSDARATYNLLVTLSAEARTLKETRGVQTDLGFISILKEQNNKWNAICKLDPTFKRDGYLRYWKARMPELEEFL